MFWRSTPKEIAISLEARQAVVVREQNMRISAAWHVAMLTRWNVKKRPFPKLDSLMQRVGPRKIQTPEEQWAIFGMMAQASKARMN